MVIRMLNKLQSRIEELRELQKRAKNMIKNQAERKKRII